MATKIYIDHNGNLTGLADDVIDKLQLGQKMVERVSNVEYDHSNECWVATDIDGDVIASNPVRSAVIELEREFFNKQIEAGFARR
jgi:hypothetical protein